MRARLRDFDASVALPLFGGSYNILSSRNHNEFFFFQYIQSDAANTSGGRKNEIRRKSEVGVRLSVLSRFGHLLSVAAKPAQCFFFLNDVISPIMSSFILPLISQCTYVPTL